MKTPNQAYGSNVRVTWIKADGEAETELLIDGYVRLGRNYYLDFNEEVADPGDTEILEVYRKTSVGWASVDIQELDDFELDSIAELMQNHYMDSLETQEYIDYDLKFNQIEDEPEEFEDVEY